MTKIEEPLNFYEKIFNTRNSKLFAKPGYLLLKVLGVEFPRSVKAGYGLRLPHGASGLVVHPNTVIGNNVKLYQGVTIGTSEIWLAPVTRGDEGVKIGDGVVIGAGAKVLFKQGETITLGKGCVVGANAVVTRSIPDNEIWAGVPARLRSTRSN